MNIEIITTKNESLKEPGFGTLQVCNSILDSINAIGHSAIITVCQTLEELDDVVKRKPDLVILAVKYILTSNEETIWLSEFFAENSINFSGSSRSTLMYDSDKVLAKSFLKDKSISTPRYFTAIPGEYKRDFDIPINYPLFLKPSDTVNGHGLDESSLVNNFSEFESKVLSLYSMYKVPVLIEEHLEGQAFSVAMIKKRNGELLVSALEIVPLVVKNESMGLGQKIKKDNIEKIKIIEDNIMLDSVKRLAIDVFLDLEIRDYGRVDIKSNKNGQCFFIGVDLVPQMTNGSSYFPKAFEMEHGLNYEEIVELIVDEGISRVSLTSD